MPDFSDEGSDIADEELEALALRDLEGNDDVEEEDDGMRDCTQLYPMKPIHCKGKGDANDEQDAEEEEETSASKRRKGGKEKIKLGGSVFASADEFQNLLNSSVSRLSRYVKNWIWHSHRIMENNLRPVNGRRDKDATRVPSPAEEDENELPINEQT